MSNLSDKTTIYLDPKVKKFIKHSAVANNRSVSDINNDQFAEMLEDFDDINDIQLRRSDDTMSFEDTLKELGISYEQLQS
jgi:hypothetical protein